MTAANSTRAAKTNEKQRRRNRSSAVEYDTLGIPSRPVIAIVQVVSSVVIPTQ